MSSDASVTWISSSKGLQALQLQNGNAWPEAARGEQDLSALGKKQLLEQIAKLAFICSSRETNTILKDIYRKVRKVTAQ